MIMKNGKQIGFIYKNGKKIDKIIRHGKVYFEQGFTREKTDAALPINFDGIGKNLKDYKIYGNTKQQILPDGYTQVDYIESNGTQYIDTGYKLNGNSEIYIDYMWTNVSPNEIGMIFGVRENDDKRGFMFGDASSNNSFPVAYYGEGSTPASIAKAISTNSESNKMYNLSVKDGEFNISELGAISFTKSTFSLTNSMYIFCGNQNSSPSYKAKARIYKFNIYENDTLTRKFIPCYRNSDNEVGLYDLVNDVFYTNQGTGIFTYGSIAPTPDSPIEIKSCGDKSKNLFNKDDLIWSSNATIKYKTFYFGKGTYTMSSPDMPYDNNGKNMFILAGSVATGANSNTNGVDKNTPRTITTTDGYITIGNRYKMSDTLNLNHPKDYNWMIEKGSTATDYEPYYEGYKIPVNVRSENLFDKNNPNIYGGYLSAGGIVSGSGDPSNYDIIVYIECKPNTTYALKKMLQSDTANNRFRIGCTSEIPTRNMQTTNFFKYNDGTTETQYIYTTSSTAKYLLFYCGKNSNTTSKQQILDSIVIVESSTVPDKYIPYYNETTSIYLDKPLRKIGEYNDYIDFKNGKVVRNIYEYKITGDETWEKTYGNNLFNIDRMFNDKPFIPSYGLCNMYKYNSIQSGINANTVNGEFALQKSAFSEASVAYNLFIKNTSYSDKNLFKTYLQNLYNNNTPVIINYPLETPTEESITLPNIPTVEENNTLNIETEITPSQVYIKYKSNN